MALVTIEEANRHLRLDLGLDAESGSGAEDDDGGIRADLVLKMEQATEIVLDYLKTEGSGWDEETVPRPIHAAVLLVLSALWEDREGTGDGDYIAPNGTVARLLHRFRDPAIA